MKRYNSLVYMIKSAHTKKKKQKTKNKLFSGFECDFEFGSHHDLYHD
jgi:hypothetical protein